MNVSKDVTSDGLSSRVQKNNASARPLVGAFEGREMRSRHVHEGLINAQAAEGVLGGVFDVVGGQMPLLPRIN